MMIDKLKEDLNEILDTAIMRFEDEPELPFCVILDSGSKNLWADNVAYVKKRKIRVEIYYEFLDFEIQKKIEGYFEKEKIGWERTEAVYISEEEMYTVFYFIFI